MTTKEQYLKNEIKRVDYNYAVSENEKNIQGEADKYSTKAYLEISAQLKKIDDDIVKLDLRYYDEESISQEFYDLRKKGYEQSKADILKYSPKYAVLAYEESLKILENIQNTDIGEANSGGFSIIYDGEGEENIELTEEVKIEILNQVHADDNDRTKRQLIGSINDEAITATMGFEDKERIINNAKMTVISEASKRAQFEMNLLQNNLFKDFDSEDDLTQAAVDEFNFRADKIQNNFYSLTAQYDYDLAKKAFSTDNFELTTEFKEWKDKKIQQGDGKFIDMVSTTGQGLRDFGVEIFYGTASMANRLLLYGLEEAGLNVKSGRDRLCLLYTSPSPRD